MAATITLEQAQADLKEIVHKLIPGEEIVITEGDKPIARLVSEPSQSTQKQPRRPGLLKGQVLYMAPDFNEPLDDLKEYME